MHRSNVRRRGWLPTAAGGLAAAVAAGGVALAIHGSALAAPGAMGAVAAAGADGAAAGNAAITSLDLSGTWGFTPTGRPWPRRARWGPWRPPVLTVRPPVTPQSLRSI